MTSFSDEADRLVLLVGMLRQVDLRVLLETIEHAESLGPIVYPGEYRDAAQRGALWQIRDLAIAAQRALDVYDSLEAAVLARQAAEAKR